MEPDALRVERYRARAIDLMVMAAASKTQGMKAEFLVLAAEYKRLANEIESGVPRRRPRRRGRDGTD